MKNGNHYCTPEAYYFKGDGFIPNSKLPVLVYRQAVPADGERIQEIFEKNGWSIGFRAARRLHPFQHFHSNVHEVIGVGAGEVTGLIGGQTGQNMTLRSGDVIVLPAGTGHLNIQASDDLLITGGYPSGLEHLANIHRGDPNEYDIALQIIARVPMPAKDPVYGNDGPLLQIWSQI